MSDGTSHDDSSRVTKTPAEPAPVPDERLRGAVIVAVVPGQSARVVKEAVRYSVLLKRHLLVVNVDVTRFVTYEDPDGYVHSAPIDMHVAPGEVEFDVVRDEVAAILDGHGIEWSLEQLVGDPALAIKYLAERIDAALLVIGTRRRGIGESIREFFTGSVAARLAHRQHRPILIVPLGESVADDESIWPE